VAADFAVTAAASAFCLAVATACSYCFWYPQAARDAAVAAVRAVLTGDAAQKEQAKNRAADALAKAQRDGGVEGALGGGGLRGHGRGLGLLLGGGDRLLVPVATAKQKAEAAAVTAKSAATQGAFYAAIALLLGSGEMPWALASASAARFLACSFWAASPVSTARTAATAKQKAEAAAVTAKSAATQGAFYAAIALLLGAAAASWVAADFAVTAAASAFCLAVATACSYCFW
jgi:hypothetical protein